MARRSSRRNLDLIDRLEPRSHYPSCLLFHHDLCWVGPDRGMFSKLEPLDISMPRYKVLKSVAHNIGHSFTSLMNYAGDDYVMGHILRFPRSTGHDTLTIDFVKRDAGPQELLGPPISEVPTRYTDWFWDLVQRHGSDRSLVQSATLTLRYDIATNRPLLSAPQFIESPFTCDVRITDVRGKNYLAHFDGWWYPERLERPQSESSPWWKFWAARGQTN